MAIQFFKNNFSLLRHLFCLQVITVHTAEFLDFPLPPLVSNFPGVPAFFFVSGFLVFSSYQRSLSPAHFFYKRAVRLFPGLIFVTFGGLGLILLSLGFSIFYNLLPQLFVWFFAQITIFQAYNPSAFRVIGIGVINGSLWTITVELLFYLTVPLVAFLIKRFSSSCLYFIFVVSFMIYCEVPQLTLFSVPGFPGKTLYDLLLITPFPWYWIFVTGILAFLNLDRLLACSQYIFLAVPFLLLLASLNIEGPFFHSSGNHIGLLYFLPYVFIILIASYITPVISIKYDLSYGAYLWHALLINLFVQFNLDSALLFYFLLLLIASASYWLVEKPASRYFNSFSF